MLLVVSLMNDICRRNSYMRSHSKSYAVKPSQLTGNKNRKTEELFQSKDKWGAHKHAAARARLFTKRYVYAGMTDAAQLDRTLIVVILYRS